MEQKGRGGQTARIVLLLFLTVGLIFSFLPSGGTVWRGIFSFFGLTDFAAAADGSPMSLHVLEVGKADCILIQCEGKSMLVDGGTFDRGESVAEYLSRRGVRRLDYVVNTHPDGDHIGGLAEVLSRFSVGSYLSPHLPADLMPHDEDVAAVQKVLKEKRIPAASPESGDVLSLGKLELSVLAPLRPGKNTNNNSLVLRLTYGKTAFLLMGDAEAEEEADLLASGAELSADVLKVGHHGSATSSIDALLRAVRPKFAAVSVADDSSHLPKREVLCRLRAVGAKVCRTDVGGTLLFLSDGERVTFLSERPV